jgi:hypothetical protein
LWGTALLIKKNVVKNIGYLDEKYFAYYEDIEYSIRALEAGYKNLIIDKAKIYHKGDRPWAKVHSQHYYYYIFRNELLMKLGYLTKWESINFKRKYLANILYNLSHFVKDQNGHKDSIDAVLLGAWHGVKRVGGKMRASPDMPWLLKKILVFVASHPPYLWAYFFRGEFIHIFKMGVNKILRKNITINI